jgi:mono/diheme cytochrome c family protein
MNSGWTPNSSTNTKSVTRGAVVLAVVLAAVSIAYIGGTRSVRADTKPSKTTQDGVFTADQASRGKAQYTETCASCHMDDLSGSGQALPLAGDAFTQTWEGQTVDDLYELIHTTMPQDKPGNLTPEQTVDVVSYLLQYNKFPAGKDELKSDADALKDILITTAKKSGD